MPFVNLMLPRVAISRWGIDFGGGVDLSGKWFVLLQLVRMGKSLLEEGGCGNSLDLIKGEWVKCSFEGEAGRNEQCSLRAKRDMRENA